jgi:hypothetical protein
MHPDALVCLEILITVNVIPSISIEFVQNGGLFLQVLLLPMKLVNR